MTTHEGNLSPEQNEAQNPSETGTTESNSFEQQLQQKVSELEAQVKEKESKYVYLYADFENYKKRAIKDRSDLQKFGWEPVARELLQVIDNLERAVEHMPAGVDENFAKGIDMVLNQFRFTLQKQGVEVIPTAKQPFDPNLHEAVSQEPSAESPAGTILKEHQKGYTLHGRLLRPARVVVSV